MTRDGRVDVGVLAGLAALLAGALRALLPRMRRDLTAAGGLRPATTAAMYVTYAGYGGLLAGAATHEGLPLPSRPARVLGATAVVLGTAVTTAGVAGFPDAAQVSGRGECRLVTGGVYRWSRNPQYLGLSVAAAGVAVARRSLPALLAAAAYPLVTGRWIRDEERHLEERFGDAYRAYRRRTPRWLGRAGPQRP